MEHKIKIMLFNSIFLMLFSCANDSQDDLVDQVPVINNVTYNTHIKSIVQNNCLSCHSNPTQNGAPMSLTNYQEVRDAVLNRGLINRLNDNVNPMPPSGNLPNTTIALFTEWQNDGLLE